MYQVVQLLRSSKNIFKAGSVYSVELSQNILQSSESGETSYRDAFSLQQAGFRVQGFIRCSGPAEYVWLPQLGS